MASANLTPASGCQSHTTSPFASASFVSALFACPTLPRPPHPLPNVFDDRENAPLWAGTSMDIVVIWGRRETEQFCARGWTGKSRDSPDGQISRRLRPTRGVVLSVLVMPSLGSSSPFGIAISGTFELSFALVPSWKEKAEMKKLLLGLLVTLPIAFATQASAFPGGAGTKIMNSAFASNAIEIKGGHGYGRGGGNGWGRGGGHRAFGWSQGRKVGWHGRGCPPGLWKQGRC